MPAFLSIEQVAVRLGVTVRTVKRMIKQGSLPGAFRLDPLTTRSPYQVPEGDVQRIEQQRKDAEDPPA